MKTITQKLIEGKNIEQTYTGNIYDIAVKDEILCFRTISEFNDFFSKINGLSEINRKIWEKKVGFRSLYSEFIEVSKRHTPSMKKVKRELSNSTIVKQNPFGHEYLTPNIFLWDYSYIVNVNGDLIIQGVKFNLSDDGIYNYESRRKIKISIEPEELDLDLNTFIEAGRSKRTNDRITYTGYDPKILKYFGFDDNSGNIQNIYDENHPNPHPSAGGAGWGPNYGWYPKLWRGYSDTWTDVGFNSDITIVVQTKMFFSQNQINGLQVRTVSGIHVRLYYRFENQLFDWPQMRLVEIYGSFNNGNFVYSGSKPIGGVSTSWYQQLSQTSGMFLNDSLFKFSNSDLGGNNAYTFKDYLNNPQNQRPNISTMYFPHDANFGIVSSKGVPYYDFCAVTIRLVLTKLTVVNPIGPWSPNKVETDSLDRSMSIEVYDGMLLY